MAITYDDYDFIEFNFNGKSSRDFNLYVVSSGKRYQDNLVPDFTDQTEARVGADGTNYFGSQFTKRQKSINVAFDELSEVQLRELRTWLGTKEVCPLIFSEVPYKQYYAKLQNAPQFKYLCFTNDSGERVYKGEGTINFIYYYPFAKAVHKYLSEYSAQDYPNKSQWAAASKLPPTRNTTQDFCTTTITTPNQIINNVGDKDANWSLTFPRAKFNSSARFFCTYRYYDVNATGWTASEIPNHKLKLYLPTGDTQGSILERIAAATNTGEFEINSALQNITYIDTGNIFGKGAGIRIPCNTMITSGDFFTLPAMADYGKPSDINNTQLILHLQISASSQSPTPIDFKWDILYY